MVIIDIVLNCLLNKRQYTTNLLTFFDFQIYNIKVMQENALLIKLIRRNAMSFSNVLTQTSILFILLIAGYVIKKLDITSDDMIAGISKLVLKFTLPIVIFISMNKEFSWDKLYKSGIVLGIGLISYIVAILVSKVVVKIFNIDKQKQGVYRFLMIFPNTALMGFPIAQAIFGDDGLFYAVIYNILFNLFVWSLGIKLLSESSTDPYIREQANAKGNTLKKIFLNPGMVAVFLGLILFVSPVKLPYVVAQPLHILGELTSPLAMLVVGGLLANVGIGSMFKNTKLMGITAVRIVLLPAITLGICKMFGLSYELGGVISLLSGMPTAADAAMFARRYESDYNLASQGVFTTTLFNLLTTPAIIFIAMKLFDA